MWIMNLLFAVEPLISMERMFPLMVWLHLDGKAITME